MSRKHLMWAFPLLTAALLASCSDGPQTKEGGEAAAKTGEYERGPHRGRMLRDGDFALEVTIFEDGVDPEFRVYAFLNDKPVKPGDVKLTMELGRLGGKIDRFSFTPQEDFLRGSGVVTEPHSFDVRVAASEGGRNHKWSYASYEGRTTITAEAAKAGGVKVEAAGGATVSDLIDMGGRIEITPEGKADVRARLPGLIMSLNGKLGQQVRRGQVLARVESSHSLQTYSVTAPISGTIVEKNVNVGDTTGDRALFVIADPTKLHAEFFVYPRDAERVRVGQPVNLRSLSGEARFQGEVEAILPTADISSQTLMAHVHLPPAASRTFRPGMGVEGSFAVAQADVPLAVRTKAIQRFRDFEVVFAKVGDTTGDRALFVIADPTKLHAEFFVYPRDAERVRVGQPVNLRSLSGEARFAGEVEAILPTADISSQTLMAHVHLPPAASRTFRPGMGVEGSFAVAQADVPLAVRTKAIQRFRDFEVVFAKVGNTYEVRMLEIGRRTPEWTEVLGGLAPGETYVVDGAFLIRADIEKSGASHDH